MSGASLLRCVGEPLKRSVGFLLDDFEYFSNRNNCFGDHAAY